MFWKGVSKCVQMSYYHILSFSKQQNKINEYWIILILKTISADIISNIWGPNFSIVYSLKKPFFQNTLQIEYSLSYFTLFTPCYIPRGDISYIYTTLEMSFEVTSLMQTDSVYNYFLSYLFWIKSLYIFWQISH